jgi:hypothetical protein
MVAVINSVVGGSAVAIAVGVAADASLGAAVAAGAVAALASWVALYHADRRLHQEGREEIQPLFPSPPVEGDAGYR